MIKGGALFYDGIKPRKLQWLVSNKKNMAIPDGFQMSQVWFLKQEAQGGQCGQQEFESLVTITDPITSSSRTLASPEKKDVEANPKGSHATQLASL